MIITMGPFDPRPITLEDAARDLAATEKRQREREAMTELLREGLENRSLVLDSERSVLGFLPLTENKLTGLKSGLWLGVVFGFWVGVFAALWMVKFGGVKP